MPTVLKRTIIINNNKKTTKISLSLTLRKILFQKQQIRCFLTHSVVDLIFKIMVMLKEEQVATLKIIIINNNNNKN